MINESSLCAFLRKDLPNSSTHSVDRFGSGCDNSTASMSVHKVTPVGKLEHFYVHCIGRDCDNSIVSLTVLKVRPTETCSHFCSDSGAKGTIVKKLLQLPICPF